MTQPKEHAPAHRGGGSLGFTAIKMEERRAWCVAIDVSDIIIVGCGRVGSRLALMLSEHDNNVCVIDRDPSAFAALGRDFNGSTFVGVGYDEEILVNAGIEECDFVAAVTQSDNANLMVVEIARRLYDVPHAVARLYDSSHERTYLQLGIDYVCGTTLVAEEIFSKAISGIGDHIATFGDFEVLQFALNLSEVGQKSIKVADLESRHGIRVCAFERADGTVSSIPSPSSILYHGDAVLAVVSHAMLPAIAKYAQD